MQPHLAPLGTGPLEPDAVETDSDSRNEKLYERFTEDFYGSSRPFTERERLMDLYGLRERDFR